MSSSSNPKDLLGIKKPQVNLVPGVLLLHTAKAMENGASKYGPYNWRSTNVNMSIYIAAAIRHLLALQDGEDIASDSGVHHCGHVAACMAIILDALEGGWLNDDRPLKGPVPHTIDVLSNSVSNDVTGHSVKRDISHPVVPVPAPDDPLTLGTLVDNITDVMRPDNNGPNSWRRAVAIRDPVTGAIEGWIANP